MGTIRSCTCLFWCTVQRGSGLGVSGLCCSPTFAFLGCVYPKHAKRLPVWGGVQEWNHTLPKAVQLPKCQKQWPVELLSKCESSFLTCYLIEFHQYQRNKPNAENFLFWLKTSFADTLPTNKEFCYTSSQAERTAVSITNIMIHHCHTSALCWYKVSGLQ